MAQGLIGYMAVESDRDGHRGLFFLLFPIYSSSKVLFHVQATGLLLANVSYPSVG